MNISEAKKILIAEYLQSVGITPYKRQGNNLWYFSPFRNETEPSFKVNLARNEWYDFGTGTGGDIFKFVMEQHGTNDISRVLNIISGKMLNNQNAFSFRQQENLPVFENIQILPLENKALIQFLQGRKIYIPFAQRFCREIHYQLKDKSYFAVGFENDLHGYELRNEYFQGCLPPKTVTTVKNGNENAHCCIFEGFMDFLSYLTLLQKQNHNAQTFNKLDYIILNSVSNVSKAISIVKNYKNKYCYLDNDKSGISAFQEIRNNCGENVFDRSIHYQNYKDLNDYLCGKKQILNKVEKIVKKSKGMRI